MTWTELLGNELLTKQGVKPTEELLAGKKYVGIYFSAHWCPPCRAFTPILSESYDAFIEDDHEDFAIVFVSSDKDEEQFNGYYSQMPFYSLPYKYRELKEELAKQKYEVKTIPCLVFLNSAGEIVTKEGRNLVADARGAPGLVLSALAQLQ
ncbi:unnamed protein product [Aphanomyces euteiches]|uniref:Thioredoxin domain-containing protein n=1 Tax=Aphanomyces euteiches TaxID=100861 RepID=A0A6G0XRG2_9STRA|nr:hypothetical protein Ae201684_002304 [Aphanomyces euteiches]KAH9087455.1 hypothetical protein Ae201684P_000862 [Aphanomyces euteiches]KAH9150750.1 hypothetical protein AeRB84_006461 [Aphanomyces euteiches]